MQYPENASDWAFQGRRTTYFEKTMKNGLFLKPSLIKLDLIKYVNKAVITFTILITY